MVRKEPEQKLVEALFIGILIMLLFFAGAFFEALASGRENQYDNLKEASIDYQQRKRGYITEYGDSGYMAYGIEPVGYLLDGRKVNQEFLVTEEMLQYNQLAVGIEVATYGRKNAVNLYVEISQSSEGEVGYSKLFKVDGTTLKDNKDINIILDTEGMIEGISYVSVYSDATSGNQAVTVYTTQNCVFAPNIMIAGSQKEANLVMRVFTPYGAKKIE